MATLPNYRKYVGRHKTKLIDWSSDLQFLKIELLGDYALAVRRNVNNELQSIIDLGIDLNNRSIIVDLVPSNSNDSLGNCGLAVASIVVSADKPRVKHGRTWIGPGGQMVIEPIVERQKIETITVLTKLTLLLIVGIDMFDDSLSKFSVIAIYVLLAHFSLYNLVEDYRQFCDRYGLR